MFTTTRSTIASVDMASTSTFENGMLDSILVVRGARDEACCGESVEWSGEGQKTRSAASRCQPARTLTASLSVRPPSLSSSCYRFSSGLCLLEPCAAVPLERLGSLRSSSLASGLAPSSSSLVDLLSLALHHYIALVQRRCDRASSAASL